MKLIKVIVFNLLLLLVLMEFALHIYNPFPATVKGERIILRANYETLTINKVNPKLPPEILVSKNAIGFRGPNPDADAEYKIIAVGGSTTECIESPDTSTWPYVLGEKLGQNFKNIWVNNAGLSGHSTFGHIILMEDYILKLKPDAVIFLVGVNDVGRDIPDNFSLYNDFQQTTLHKIKEFLYKSELISVSTNIYRFINAKRAQLVCDLDFDITKTDTLLLDPLKYQELIQRNKAYLIGYEQRLIKLMDLCIENGITPVLVTQPALYGDSIDPATQVDLSKVKVGEYNGKTLWECLELYNNITRKVSSAKNIPLIDLAHLLPKNSDYFTDYVHYTPLGNQLISDIMKPVLADVIKLKIQTINPENN